MTHPREELTAFLDGALEPAERERIADHLAGCAACRAERDRLASTVALLARLERPPAPSPDFEARFLARLAAEPRRRRGLAARLGLTAHPWRWLAPGLAGAVATALVMLYSGGRRGDDAFLAEHLDLFDSFEEVASVGAIDAPDDVQVVAHLHELRGMR